MFDVMIISIIAHVHNVQQEMPERKTSLRNTSPELSHFDT